MNTLTRSAASLNRGIAVLASIVAAVFFVHQAYAQAIAPDVPEAKKQQIEQFIGNSAVEFLENRGQVLDDNKQPVPQVRFTAKARGAVLYFEPDRVVHAFIKVEENQTKTRRHPIEHSTEPVIRYSRERVDFELLGAQKNVVLRGQHKLPGATNFLLADLGEGGITDVPSYATIVYENIYPHIDLIFKQNGKGIKGEFIVHPGGDPTLIRMRYTGAKNIQLLQSGGYRVETQLGYITEDAPIAFVRTTDGELPVRAEYVLEGDVIRFNIGSYDRSKTLVIDPNREWGSFHGGGLLDVVTNITIHRGVFNPPATEAVAYVCGYTQSSNYPTTGGAFQTSLLGSVDAFVSAYRYGPNTTRFYSTYYGGSNSDWAYGIAVDLAGTAYIVGHTNSDDLPGTALYGTYQAQFDGYVAHINATGTGVLARRYIGGTLNDWLRDVFFDPGTNAVYVGGYSSNNGLAIGAGVYQNTNFSSIHSGIVARMSDNLAAVSWLTYYGTTGGSPLTVPRETVVRSVWVTTSGATVRVWIGGYTNATGGIATTGSFNENLNNNQGTTFYDGFVAVLNGGDGSRIAGTYYGAEADDYVYDVAADPASPLSAVFAVGVTYSPNVSNLIASTNGFTTTLNDGANTTSSDGFITRLTLSGTTLGRDWGSYWGDDDDDELHSVWVDDNNVTEAGTNTISAGRGLKIYVTGASNRNGTAFPAAYNFPTGAGNFNVTNGGYDVIWSRIFRGGAGPTVEYSAQFGSTGTDIGYGIAVDNMRNVHIGGYVGSGFVGSGQGVNQGTNPQNTFGGGGDGFVNKWCDLIRPNAPQYSTDGGATWTATSVCQNLNSSATGFQLVASPTYPQLPNNTDWAKRAHALLLQSRPCEFG
ncbi:MAG: SBBP repeat-containing protein [Bacteroidota bacterium]|nr:SBBP repeat-containing protein [Bacteroidota bacterium]